MHNIIAPKRTAGGVTVETVDITPEIASKMLARNTRNRGIKRLNLEKLERALRNGDWMQNGEAIKVAVGGDLLDGQHRLTAVVNTGVTMRTIVITGLTAASQDTMDTGRPRALHDVLAIRGESNSLNLAAQVRKLYVASEFGLAAACNNSLPAITIKECVDFLDLNPWVRDVLGPADRVAKANHLPSSLAGVLIVALSEIDQDDADHFFGRLVDGIGLADGDPIYVLRRTLENLTAGKSRTVPQKFAAAVVIKAWNKYRDGESIGLLKYRPGGANPEAFPEPR